MLARKVLNATDYLQICELQKNKVHPSSVVDNGATIGEGTAIWHFCHICNGAVIGNNCSIGQNVLISDNAVLGNGVKIQNNVAVLWWGYG